MADIKVTITEQVNPSVTISEQQSNSVTVNTIPRATLSSEISSNDADITSLNVATGALDTSISGLETATGVLGGLITSNDLELAALNVATGALGGLITSNDLELAALNVATGALGTSVSTIESTFVSGDSDASLKDLTLDGHFKLNIPSANRTPGTSVALIKSDNGTAANLRVEGPIAATHDLFKNSGVDNGFADNSNHFHTVQKINRITQQVGAGKPNERVQEQYYAIASNNLKNGKAAFWNWHKVSRTISNSSVSLTNLVGWNFSAIQDSDNRLSSSEAPFPAGGAEATVLTFDNESNRAAELSNGDLLQVTISIDFEGAIVAATLYAEVASVNAEQATVVLYGGNYKSIGQVAKGSDQIALTSGFTISKIDTSQYIPLSVGTGIDVLSDSARTTSTDTFSITFASAHGLELNDVVTILTDGDATTHGFKDAEVAFVKEVTSTTVAKFVYGRVFEPAGNLALSNVNSSSVVGVLKGTLDGLHRFTAGDQLMHFNADSEGRYKSYQIGPGSEVGADCIAIGKNVYNKDASTIKIGYDNAMLDVRSDGIVVEGSIKGSNLAAEAAGIKFSNYTSTSIGTVTTPIDPNQSNIPADGAGNDTTTDLAVDQTGNVVRTTQEATWTLTEAQINALTTNTSGVELIQAPGANKFVIIEKATFLINYAYNGSSMSTTQQYHINQDGNVSDIIAVLNGTRINNITKDSQSSGTGNSDTYGIYEHDTGYSTLNRTYKPNKATTLRRLNTNAIATAVTSMTIKIRYRVYDVASF